MKDVDETRLRLKEGLWNFFELDPQLSRRALIALEPFFQIVEAERWSLRGGNSAYFDQIMGKVNLALGKQDQFCSVLPISASHIRHCSEFRQIVIDDCFHQEWSRDARKDISGRVVDSFDRVGSARLWSLLEINDDLSRIFASATCDDFILSLEMPAFYRFLNIMYCYLGALIIGDMEMANRFEAFLSVLPSAVPLGARINNRSQLMVLVG